MASVQVLGEIAMREDERISDVKGLLFNYVRSPSLRHIRDPHSLHRLAIDIVKRLDRGNSAWKKWDDQREALLKSAMPCWIPVDALRDYLNGMSGPALTRADVSGRLKAAQEEQYEFPDEELQAGCLALYEREKAEGTELPAIIQVIRDHLEREEERIRLEQDERRKQWVEEERLAREQRLLSGADCTWTQLQNSRSWHCRVNGRTYRLSPTRDSMWHLHRVETTADDAEGLLLGKYQRRGDATKAVKQMAYQPEPKR
jgi:hypothetical protein